MSRVLTAMLGAALLAGCTSEAQTLSVWQRYDGLQPVLTRVTAENSLVAADVTRVQHAMHHGDSQLVRQATVRARADARRLSRHAGSAGKQVRDLSLRARRASVQRRYLTLVGDALGQQQTEGQTVVAIAELVWHDPLILSPRSVPRLRALQRQAHRSSSTAVADCRRATAMRQEVPRAFRYVPVALPGGDKKPRGH